MKYRRRIYYSSLQRAEIWDRWQRGVSMSSIGRRFDRESSSVFSVISPTGGIRPAERCRCSRVLSLSEREEISRGLSIRRSLRAIARQLGRAPSTISREIKRNGGCDRYRATASDQAAWDRALRPKLCRLACYPALSRTVSKKLRRNWSPEQIAGWLKRAFPGEVQNQVSHETIYRSLYIQAGGVLKKELLEHLRAKHTIRRSRHGGDTQVSGECTIHRSAGTAPSSVVLPALLAPPAAIAARPLPAGDDPIAERPLVIDLPAGIVQQSCDPTPLIDCCAIDCLPMDSRNDRIAWPVRSCLPQAVFHQRGMWGICVASIDAGEARDRRGAPTP